MEHTHHRDLIVVGASAGGVHALSVVLASLPSKLAASVVVVQHLAPGADRYLTGILQRTSALPVSWADDDVERALWMAVCALHDRATTLTTLAYDAEQVGNSVSANDFQIKARDAEQAMELVRQFMLELLQRT